MKGLVSCRFTFAMLISYNTYMISVIQCTFLLTSHVNPLNALENYDTVPKRLRSINAEKNEILSRHERYPVEVVTPDESASSRTQNEWLLDFETDNFEREMQTMSMPSSCIVPPPFDDSSTRKTVHVVMNNQSGEFFDLLVIGMIEQVLKAENVELVVTSANGDPDGQAQLVQQAIDNEATSIITVEGGADKMCNVINEAIKNQGTPVLSYNFQGDNCVPEHLLAFQSEIEIANQVLSYAADTINRNTTTNIGYVTDVSSPPLQRQNQVYEDFKSSSGWKETFRITDAAAYESETELQSVIVGALSEAESDGDGETSFIFAPWGYAALQATLVSDSRGGSVKVFGADVNDQIIIAMTESTTSPWVATSGGDPTMIGAALIRSSMIQMTGRENFYGVESITIPSFLITQDFLRVNQVRTLLDLRRALPAINLSEIGAACWI